MPDWGDVLKEVQTTIAQYQMQAQAFGAAAHQALDSVRRKYLAELRAYTGRNVITYYSGWLSKPGISQSDINDEDKNGFMMAVHSIGREERALGLDLFLHTPGGDIAATESIVNYLHQMFGNDIRAIVPQIAMSAGTMIACSCSEILMARHSNLGPIDPHLRGMPAYGVKQEFERACKEVAKDATKIPIWQSIISRYGPAFLSQCENAIDWSKSFVEKQLEQVMFESDAHAVDRSRRIVRKLTDYRGNKTHARHIHYDELREMGLKVSLIEEDQRLQDLTLTVHHCYMHALMNTPAYKMIESHKASAFIKAQFMPQGQPQR